MEGERIGPYEIVHVAEGGMGTVYFVNNPYDEPPDALTPNLLVLKTLKDGYLHHKRTRARFEHEALTWVRLMANAPRDVNVVKAHRVETYTNRPYIVMEYVGPNLRGWFKLVREEMGQLLTEESLSLAIQVCDGMAYLGEQLKGFVHRDIKPENVLVKWDQRFGLTERRWIKITDLGLSKVLDEYEVGSKNRHVPEGHLATKTGPLGTHYYMSPEQRVNAKLVSATSDIYSFGIMLFEMLGIAGDFETAQWSNIMNRLADELPENRALTPKSINPDVPEELNHVVMKCLERNPEDRYPDFWTLGTTLRSIHSEPIHMRMNNRLSDLEVLHEQAFSLANLGKYEEAGELFDRIIQLLSFS